MSEPCLVYAGECVEWAKCGDVHVHISVQTHTHEYFWGDTQEIYQWLPLENLV